MKPILVAGAFAASMLAAPPIVIQNATILTVTKGTINNGSVLIRDGKIAEVGENIVIRRFARYAVGEEIAE